ncbi:trk system potassium uptake protein TrkH [Paracidovorax citrulli]|uniref:Trk system potassium uptake protein n=3 Tax=Pseudomonadota TaxID=1224 RepID=A1TVU2_PARC0|nr:cation transporter [Paracidovorax citrulli AAC00-1]PVY64529.1 trk system potassium uptake protein TrkH [Paracidovorax citrulli]REG71272.1 trk system potassium uptake protein TrkH [Paracidovorax citrulli]RLJ95825.1 trk system potassium uptake protein TrkH [Paracidovorax citrulli]
MSVPSALSEALPDLLPVLRVFGALLAMFSWALAVPLGASLWAGEGLWPVYAASLGFALACGVALWLGLRRHARELQPRHGVMLVSLVWLLLPLFASLPLMGALHAIDRPIGFTHAYFEAVSGLTTTGATVLSGLDSLPLSVNIWRTFMQWIGGMGILILAVAVLPLLGVGGSQLFKAEAAGPVKDTKLTPRMTQTAKGLWGVYVVFSLVCALAFWAGGMVVPDALMHMFATVSLGGLSPYDASFGHFHSPLLEAIAIVFMVLASCNFALYFVALRKGHWRTCWRDPELRATVCTLLGSGLFVALLLWFKGIYGPLDALRHGMFHTVSVATTTGFATTDYLGWPVFAPVFLLMLSGVATSAGSTGGGIKMVRVLILLQQARREMTRLVHPRAVQPVRLGATVVENRMIFAVLAYMLVYGATITVLSMVLLLTDLDVVTAFSAVIASVHCTGPGLGLIGPAANYAVLTDFQLWVCTLAMLLGRLEILSFMALLTPAFWRR